MSVSPARPNSNYKKKKHAYFFFISPYVHVKVSECKILISKKQEKRLFRRVREFNALKNCYTCTSDKVKVDNDLLTSWRKIERFRRNYKSYIFLTKTFTNLDQIFG